VWVITLVLGIGALLGILNTSALLLTGNPLAGDESVAYLRRLHPAYHAYSLLVSLFYLVALVWLFRLKRSSLPLLVIAFGLVVAKYVLLFVIADGYRLLIAQAPWATAVPIAIYAAVVFYVSRLLKRGTLRP